MPSIMRQYEGFLKLREAFVSDEMVMKFLMLEKGLYLELANANANSIRGFNTGICLWYR
jgi:hypothetical protein